MKTSLIIALTMLLPFSSIMQAETRVEKEARMKWFNEARFGMFIHFGVYSQAAGNWKGKPVNNIGEWIQSFAQIPIAEYRAELQDKFNPVKYDPEPLVIAAKNAGIKYLVITAKHHDGFCLWDSKLTDWDIASTPYKKDLLGPLEEACRKHGIRFCVYYSIMDWSHPDYGDKAPWRGNASNPSPDKDRYNTYLKGQLDELISNYHPGIMWFDGEWEKSWTHEQGVDLYEWLRKKDPALIINNRVDKGRKGMEGNTTDPKFKGDYGTPEQQVPAIGFGEGVSWESCMTMNKTWGYKSDDNKWKSTENLVQNLIDIASKGGNYLLNVGPTGEGEIPQASLERLAQIGDWMKVNGESIHGTTASLFSKRSWNGRSTTRRLPNNGTRIYVHVFGQPPEGTVTLDNLVTRPTNLAILGDDDKPEISGSEGAWKISLPKDSVQKIATVLVLDFPGKPEIKEENAKP